MSHDLPDLRSPQNNHQSWKNTGKILSITDLDENNQTTRNNAKMERKGRGVYLEEDLGEVQGHATRSCSNPKAHQLKIVKYIKS